MVFLSISPERYKPRQFLLEYFFLGTRFSYFSTCVSLRTSSGPCIINKESPFYWQFSTGERSFWPQHCRGVQRQRRGRVRKRRTRPDCPADIYFRRCSATATNIPAFFRKLFFYIFISGPLKYRSPLKLTPIPEFASKPIHKFLQGNHSALLPSGNFAIYDCLPINSKAVSV